MRVAYIRVSTLDQNPDRQLRVDIEKNYIDKCSGSISFSERPEAKKLLSNTNVTEIVVHSIDRLGRNTIDIMQTIQHFTNLGAYEGRPTGTVEDIEKFISKKSTQSILKYLRQGESINRTAKLSETSTGTVKKVKLKIKEGLITL